MVLHPRIAHRAQEEIDTVIGGRGVRPPMFEDRKNLPYLECVLKEVLRYVFYGYRGCLRRLRKLLRKVGILQRQSVRSNLRERD